MAATAGKARFRLTRKVQLMQYVLETYENRPDYSWQELWNHVKHIGPGVQGTRHEGQDLEPVMFDEWKVWYKERHTGGENRIGHGKGSEYYKLMHRWHDCVNARPEYKIWRSRRLTEWNTEEGQTGASSAADEDGDERGEDYSPNGDAAPPHPVILRLKGPAQLSNPEASPQGQSSPWNAINNSPDSDTPKQSIAPENGTPASAHDVEAAGPAQSRQRLMPDEWYPSKDEFERDEIDERLRISRGARLQPEDATQAQEGATSERSAEGDGVRAPDAEVIAQVARTGSCPTEHRPDVIEFDADGDGDSITIKVVDVRPGPGAVTTFNGFTVPTDWFRAPHEEKLAALRRVRKACHHAKVTESAVELSDEDASVLRSLIHELPPHLNPEAVVLVSPGLPHVSPLRDAQNHTHGNPPIGSQPATSAPNGTHNIPGSATPSRLGKRRRGSSLAHTTSGESAPAKDRRRDRTNSGKRQRTSMDASTIRLVKKEIHHGEDLHGVHAPASREQARANEEHDSGMRVPERNINHPEANRAMEEMMARQAHIGPHPLFHAPPGFGARAPLPWHGGPDAGPRAGFQVFTPTHFSDPSIAPRPHGHPQNMCNGPSPLPFSVPASPAPAASRPNGLNGLNGSNGPMLPPYPFASGMKAASSASMPNVPGLAARDIDMDNPRQHAVLSAAMSAALAKDPTMTGLRAQLQAITPSKAPANGPVLPLEEVSEDELVETMSRVAHYAGRAAVSAPDKESRCLQLVEDLASICKLLPSSRTPVKEAETPARPNGHS